MSLYPLKIAGDLQETKIKDLKQAVDYALESLSANFKVPSEGIKEIKSLTSNLISVCLSAYEKEKRNSADLKQQFDEIQQEAVKEFNLRQNDFIKQLDLFENELKKLRQENRDLFGQIESLTFTFEKLRKSSKPIFSDILQLCNSKTSGKQTFPEIAQKMFDLQDQIESLTAPDQHKDNISEVSENLPPIDSYENSYLNRPIRLTQDSYEKSFMQKVEAGFFSESKNEEKDLKKERVMYISDNLPRVIDSDRVSISSLNYFLEDSYKNSLGGRENRVLKENFKELRLEKIENVQEVKKVQSEKKDFIDTFRTGSEVQIDNNDSFRTVYQSPGENTVSTIFPALEESPKYIKYKY